jgi:hypothetical protein
MPRPCSICTHPNRETIDAEIRAGTPNRRTASKCDVSEAAVRRHRKHLAAAHAPAEPSAPGTSDESAAKTGRSRPSKGARRPPPFADRRFAREAAKKGGRARAEQLKAEKAARKVALEGPEPFGGTILDAMDAANLTGETWEAWRSFMRAVYALPMAQTDLERFTRHTGRTKPLKAPAREAWLVVGRRGGKSRMAALAALYQAIRRDYSKVLAPGERGIVPVIAADRLQARSTLGYLKGLLALPAFASYVGRILKDHVELRTGVDIRVSTASYRTVRGYTLVAVVCEEIAFWLSDETGSNPDSEILAALRPGMATVPGALLLGLSSPYAARGELYKAYGRYFATDDATGLAWNSDTASMNPAVDPKVIADAFRDDPVAAASEYGQGGSVAFRRDIEAFLDPEAVRGVTILDRRELAPVDGLRYVAFVDPSGGSADSFTLAIAHREEGRAILDLVRERRPPFSPDDVVREFAETLDPYGVGWVAGDRYGGEWPRERFAAHGIGYEPSERTKSDIYRELLPSVNAGRVELLDLPRLAAQLAGLERRVSRGGRDSIDHLPGGHDDVANAAAGALVIAIEGQDSTPHDPKDDEPFDAWSQEALEVEFERTHRVKPFPTPQGRNIEFGVT